jgi:hypothetical protein
MTFLPIALAGKQDFLVYSISHESLRNTNITIGSKCIIDEN